MIRFWTGSANGDAGAGLRLLAFDPESGTISERSRVPDAKNPIYLAAAPDGARLYAPCDVLALAPDPEVAGPGGVASFSVGPDGSLRRMAAVALSASVPCHVSLSPDARTLFWAAYREGRWGAVRTGPDGSLAPLAAFALSGRTGPVAARQDAPHAHWAGLAPDGRTVFVCDLGLDRVFAWAFDPDAAAAGDGSAALRRAPALDFVAPPGTGPRHLAFVPGTDLAALVTELSSELLLLRLRPGAAPELLDRRSLLPPDFRGETKAAAVRVSPDGRWIVASNRGHDSLAAFRLDRAAGRLEPGPRSPVAGPFPRDFAFAPGGTWAVVGHKLADEVAVYRFDAENGTFAPVPGAVFPMPRPLAFLFFPPVP